MTSAQAVPPSHGGRFDIGFLVALRAEVFTALRTRGPWVLLALPAVAVAVRLLLVKFRESREAVGEVLRGGAGQPVIGNGYAHFVDGMNTGLVLLYLLLVATAAYVYAADRDNGVMRHLVTRRVQRGALVLAKFAALNVFAVLSVLATLLVAVVMSLLFWEFGPVVEDGYELIGVDEIQAEIQLGLQLALIPLPASLALGLLVATATRTAIQAVAAAIGVTLSLDVFKGVLGDAAHYIYATFQPSLIDQSYLQDVARLVRGYSDVLVDPRLQQLNMLVPIPEALLFLVLALIIASRSRL